MTSPPLSHTSVNTVNTTTGYEQTLRLTTIYSSEAGARTRSPASTNLGFMVETGFRRTTTSIQSTLAREHEQFRSIHILVRASTACPNCGRVN